MRYKVLLVEDESDLAKIISDTLSDTGYKVVSAGNGEEGLAKYLIEKPDIVVADVMMPKLDGFGMARKIRDLSSDVPIIFLTAKSGIDDIEEGFGIGANDYLRKPFELRELIVRIKALLMRQDQSNAEFMTFRIGKYIFNDENQTLSFGGKEMCLSNIEARLLKPLAANIGKTVLASDLMVAVWGRDEVSQRNSLHGYIHKLRRFLCGDPSISIVNQRGFGYMLTVK